MNFTKTIIGLTLLTSSLAQAANGLVSGCRPSDYVTASGPSVTVSISGHSYSPKCLKVSPGTAVTIQAMEVHPLQGQAPIDGVDNPFAGQDGSTQSVTKVLTAPGFYGYFCENHGSANGQGMAGAIQVQ